MSFVPRLVTGLMSILIASTAFGEGIAIRGGKILTMDGQDRVLNNGVVLVSGGKIDAVGTRKEVSIPAGYEIIDASGRWVFPGQIEGHNHIGASISDLNENVWLTNPGLRAVDAIAPGNDNLMSGLQGGVTSMLVVPGSGSNMGGFGIIMKLAGNDVEEMTLRQPGSLKIAQAGNPEGFWFGVARPYMNYNIRQTLTKAREYHESWLAYEQGKTKDKPDVDPTWEDFRPLMAKEIPTSVHTQGYQVFAKTISMLHDEFDLWTVPFHCTFDAYKTVALVVERDMHLCNGPRQLWFDRTQRTIFGHCERWWSGGVRKLCVNTDCVGGFGIPQEELAYQATVATRLGWETYPALRGITIAVAEAFGVADRVGSIEVGKDADITLWTGDPIDPRSACRLTMVDGRVVFDASTVKRRRF